MIVPVKADDATLMRIYSQGLTHTLQAAVRAVYEQGLHDGTLAATARSEVPAPTPAAPASAPTPSPTAHLTPSVKATSAK